MPKFAQGSGPLGRDVAYNEFSAATQKSTPQVIASGQGTTSIVGNGADQTVVSDTFTITPAAGDLVEIISCQSFTRTAGAGVVTNYTVALGATNIVKQAATSGNMRIQRTSAITGSGGRGMIFGEENQENTTGVDGVTVIKSSTYTATPTTFSILAQVPAGSTYSVEYSYCVKLYKTGV